MPTANAYLQYSHEPPDAHRHVTHECQLGDASDGRVGNELVAELSFTGRRKLLARVERVAINRRQVIQERNLPLRYAYFIESGAASLLARAGERSAIEVRTLGSKDLVGIPIVLGTGRSPHRCVVQVPGYALRIRAGELARLLDDSPELRRILLGYVQVALAHTGQLVVCNTRHELRHRLARWLLTASNHLSSTDLPITHDCLSRALGVRRAGITSAIGRMEQARLIVRGRGRIFIINRAGLEHECCPCYQLIQNEYKRVLTALRQPPLQTEMVA